MSAEKDSLLIFQQILNNLHEEIEVPRELLADGYRALIVLAGKLYAEQERERKANGQ